MKLESILALLDLVAIQDAHAVLARTLTMGLEKVGRCK